ncbi:MAG: lamin tail domain-containing protein [Caldilineaceae bacterium]
MWGEALTARASISLEQAGTTSAAPWQEAQGPWRAGGDWGTPGAAPGTNPPGDDQPPGPLVPTPVADVNVPAKWTWAADAAPVVIDEVAFRGSDQEFVVLRNLTEQEIDLGGWLVGDAATPGSGEGMYVLPDGLTIAPAGRVILARNAAGFVADYVLRPDAEFEESAAEVPSLSRRRDLATGQFALKDGGDEVLLLAPAGQLVDAVAYGTGDGAALGLTGTLDASGGDSLQRVDGVPPQADQRHRFAYAPPDPFRSIFLPDARAVTRPHLADGLMAAWSTLGAASNFSPDGSAPPLRARPCRRGRAGLCRLGRRRTHHALGDSVRCESICPHGVGTTATKPPSSTTALCAPLPAQALANFAAAAGLPVQWLDDPPAGAASLTAVDGQTVDVPARLPQLAATGPRQAHRCCPPATARRPMPGRVEAAPLHRSRHVRVDARGPEARRSQPGAAGSPIVRVSGSPCAQTTARPGPRGWAARSRLPTPSRWRFSTATLRASRPGWPVAGWAGPSASWTCRRWTGVGR